MTFDFKSIVVSKPAPRRVAPESLEFARIALAEFGQFLGDDDIELSAQECRDLLNVAITIMDAVPHGLDCPRSRDDYTCTCRLGALYGELCDAQDGLK